ncbi:iron-containing alcohol dehydrogenase [Marinibaculum pumilum]|uniref:Iron-containing alcohol dehydrogenase n=1 Tax=Marinibaculum pumilum TaxID=1766165 RepID=A0ABV7KU67_9PROT
MSAQDTQEKQAAAVDAGAYDFLKLERVIWGQPAAEAVLAEAELRSAGRVFIVASHSLNTKTPVVQRIADALGSRHAGTFDGCREHAPRDTVVAAILAARAARPDLIVSVGGGTVIDTVKIVLIGLAHDVTTEEELSAYRMTAGAKIAPPPCRQIAVPTTLSAAEFSNLGGSVDPKRGVKDPFTGPEVGPAAVILDPAACIYTPELLWTSTGIRAVDHAVEGLCSIRPAPLADGCTQHALRLFKEGLPASRDNPDDLEGRLLCQQAAWLAATGILRTPYGASHGIGHALGGVTGMAHGITSCVMLPAVMRWNLPATGPQQALIAAAMGEPEVPAHEQVAALVRRLGLPGRLSEAGVSRDQLPRIVEVALDNMWVKTNPRPIRQPSDVEEILELAW